MHNTYGVSIDGSDGDFAAVVDGQGNLTTTVSVSDNAFLCFGSGEEHIPTTRNIRL